LDELDDLATHIRNDMFGLWDPEKRSATLGELSHNAPIEFADIEQGLMRFQSEYRLAGQRNDEMLCAVVNTDETAIPVDSRSVYAAVSAHSDDLNERISNTERPWIDLGLLGDVVARIGGLETKVFNKDEAFQVFAGNLRYFIFTRLIGSSILASGGSGEPSGRPAPPGVLPFTVHANFEGLRIHYDPIYLHSGNGKVFGSPSSPVDHWLEPGSYIFGGATYGPPRWDPDGVYDVPPAAEAHLTLPEFPLV